MHAIVMRTPWWHRLCAWRGSDRLRRMRDAADAAFPRYMEEIQGIADGCGLTFEEAFIWNARGDLAQATAEGCTTVCIPTPSGFLLGHNEDGFPPLKEHCFFSIAPRVSRQPGYRSFNYPASLNGHTFAVNTHGLIQMVNNIRCGETGDGVPRMFLARAVLDCAEIDEAIARLRENRRAGSFHHLIVARREMRAISVEYSPNKINVIYLHRPYGHTNHFVHPAMARIPQQITPSSAARQQRMAQLCSVLPPDLDIAAILKMLRDDSDPHLPIHRTASDDPDQENTLASAVMDVSAQSIRLQAYGALSGNPVYNDRLE